MIVAAGREQLAVRREGKGRDARAVGRETALLLEGRRLPEHDQILFRRGEQRSVRRKRHRSARALAGQRPERAFFEGKESQFRA